MNHATSGPRCQGGWGQAWSTMADPFGPVPASPDTRQDEDHGQGEAYPGHGEAESHQDVRPADQGADMTGRDDMQAACRAADGDALARASDLPQYVQWRSRADDPFAVMVGVLD